MLNCNSAESEPLEGGIPTIQKPGFVLLYTSVGTSTFIKETIVRIMDKIREITGKLPKIQDAQTEYVLLRSGWIQEDGRVHQARWKAFKELVYLILCFFSWNICYYYVKYLTHSIP